MSDIQRLLQMVEAEGGKIVLIDTEGKARAVLMSMGEYEKMKGTPDLQNLASRIDRIAAETEDLNRQITLAQMQDVSMDVDDAAETETSSNPPDEQLYIEPLGGEELA